MPNTSNIEKILDAIDIPSKDEIRGNITLPTNVCGASVSWTSSNSAVITDKDQGKLLAGVVTRGNEDIKVTLTASVSVGGAMADGSAIIGGCATTDGSVTADETATKEIEVCVLAAPKKLTEDDFEGYLFGHFIGEGSEMGEQIYFALSEDGFHFEDMNDRKPVLVSNIGEKGVRDPYVYRSVEGDRFFLVATDLSIFHRGGWVKNEQGYYDASTTGSSYLVVWESLDLVNWGEPKLVKVAPENAGMAWAPEMIYNDETGEYIIFFASSIMNPETKMKAKPNAIYYVATRDFVNFSETKLFIDNQTDDTTNGQPREIIDTTLIKIGDCYYSASKDGDNDEVNGGIRIMRSKNLLDASAWEKVLDLDELGLDLSSVEIGALDNHFLEGPEFFQFNKKDWEDENVPEYGILVDQYAIGAGYLPLKTTDLEDVDNSKNSWKILGKEEYSFDQLKKRHGTVMRITREEIERLKKMLS